MKLNDTQYSPPVFTSEKKGKNTKETFQRDKTLIIVFKVLIQ